MDSLPPDTKDLLAISLKSKSGLIWKKKPTTTSPIREGAPAGYLGQDGWYLIMIRGKTFDAQRIRQYLRNGKDPGDIHQRRREQKIPQKILDQLKF